MNPLPSRDNHRKDVDEIYDIAQELVTVLGRLIDRGTRPQQAYNGLLMAMAQYVSFYVVGKPTAEMARKVYHDLGDTVGNVIVKHGGFVVMIDPPDGTEGEDGKAKTDGPDQRGGP